MMETLAAIQRGDRDIEFRELEVPHEPAEDEALLKLEGCGMCGSDYEQYVGGFAGTGLVEYPVIPGHEPVGTIVAIGQQASRHWGIAKGARVGVEPFAPCGVCRNCTRGKYILCVNKLMYGFTKTAHGAGLWGGYAGYMVLKGNTLLHRIPEQLSIQDAVLFNPIGAGFEWIGRVGNVSPGDDVAIFGPGQRGLASVIAAVVSGANRIIVSGLPRDAAKLDLALEHGATDVIVVDESVDVAERVRELTAGNGVDCAIDVTPFAQQPVRDAISAVRRGGTVVLAGIKGMRPISDFVSDRIVLDALEIRGALGVTYPSYETAIRTVASGRFDFSRWHTHTLPLEQLERGLALLGAEVDGEDALHVTIVPNDATG